MSFALILWHSTDTSVDLKSKFCSMYEMYTRPFNELLVADVSDDEEDLLFEVPKKRSAAN